MEPVLSKTEMALADRFAIDHLKIPQMVLMEHAALALALAVEKRFLLLPHSQGVILAGPGNNGGDALAAARILFEKKAKFRCFLIKVGATLSPACQAQLTILKNWGVPVEEDVPSASIKGDGFDWCIDGLFGIGLSRTPEGRYAKAIDWINGSGAYVFSADIPSGLDADTGRPMGPTVQANQTVTFGFLKRGLLTGLAADYVGNLKLDEIGIPRLLDSISPSTFLVQAHDVRKWLPKRKAASHKGAFGHVVVIAGPTEQLGACAIAALGALHSGAGLVSVATDRSCFASLRSLLPAEIMFEELGISTFVDPKRVLVIGPGLGQGAKAKGLLDQAIHSACNLVIDADGLNELAKAGASELEKRKTITVLTPHPKEASRLLNCDVESVEKNRFESLQKLIQCTGVYCLLKGKGTLIGSAASPQILMVNEGTTALAKGGSGDLLTGIVAALLAQKISPEKALASASFLHGRSAQYLEQLGVSALSVTPTQLAKTLGLVLKDMSHENS